MTLKEIQLVNPLPKALEHYELELCQTLDRVDQPHALAPVRAVEGMPGIGGRLRMLHNAIQNSRSCKDSSGPSLQVWPSLGLLEPAFWWGSDEANAVIFHDPLPLRHQIGFGSISHLVGQIQRPRRQRPLIVSHSLDAMTVSRRNFPKFDHEEVLHPIVTRQTLGRKASNPVVLVAGQYKPARDLELLRWIGPHLANKGVECRVVGRGWPQIEGWTVDSRYLSEANFESELAQAWLLLVPYRFYYQSGVALRALELGTVSLSPATSFSHSLLGDDFSLCNAPREVWLSRIMELTSSPAQSEVLFDEYKQRCDHSWHQFLQRWR